MSSNQIDPTSMDKFFDKLTEVTSTLAEQLYKVAPEVLELTLKLIQFNSIFCLVASGLGMIFAVYSLKKIRQIKIHSNGDVDSVFDVVKIVFGGFIICGGTIAFIKNWFSFNTWLGLFYPEGVLALRALEAADIHLL